MSRAVWPRLASGSRVTLSDEWRAWVIENALDGVTAQSMIARLIEAGIPRHVAQADVLAIVRSPVLDACRALRARAGRAEAVLSLRARLERDGDVAIERRTRPPATEFFERYFAGSRPVVITDMTRDWPALTKWTPEKLRDRLGDVEMEIAEEREGDPTPDRNLDQHRAMTTVREYIDRVLSSGQSNDIYTVANNLNMEREGFRPLLDDIVPDPEYFEPHKLDTATSLWIGPAGTVTPLHHDTTNILFCQIYGKKKVWLAAPHENALLESAEGFYNRYDPEMTPCPDAIADVRFSEVVLAPGDALFIPVGHWHHVRALETSISFSLLAFRRPNAFAEYKPGSL